MTEQTHRILKKSVTVQAVSRDGFALKRTVEDVLRDRVIPQLGHLFDGLVSPDEWLEIDRLDIVLDNIGENELEELLPKKIAEAVQKKIDEKPRRPKPAPLTDSAGNGYGNRQENTITTVSPAEKRMDAFCHFLQYGVIPWWFETSGHADLERQVAETWGDASADALPNESGYREKLRQILSADSAVNRLSVQFSDVFFWNFRVWLFPGRPAPEPEALNSLAALQDVVRRTARPKNVRLLPAALKKNRLQHDLRGSSSGEMRQARENLLREAFLTLTDPKTIRILCEHPDLAGYFTSAGFTETRLRDTVPPAGTKKTDRQTGTETDPQNLISSENMPVSERSPSAGTENTSSENTPIPADASPHTVYIANAGLMILAPFLPDFFNRCRLLRNNRLQDSDKAVALLRYLVYGDTDYREYDVFLEKLLCGRPPGETLHVLTRLPKRDRQKADELLTDVIGHWSALKNTTVDGLREGFLQRAGKLERRYDAWHLHPEQKAHDVLLKLLPWSFGHIRFSWMHTLVKTEWI